MYTVLEKITDVINIFLKALHKDCMHGWHIYRFTSFLDPEGIYCHISSIRCLLLMQFRIQGRVRLVTIPADITGLSQG